MPSSFLSAFRMFSWSGLDCRRSLSSVRQTLLAVTAPGQIHSIVPESILNVPHCQFARQAFPSRRNRLRLVELLCSMIVLRCFEIQRKGLRVKCMDLDSPPAGRIEKQDAPLLSGS